MYLSFTANRKQFINALYRYTGVHPDVRDTAFSTFTFRTNEKNQGRKIYDIGHIGFTVFTDEFTWSIMLVCPSTQPVSNCRIILTNGNSGDHYINVALSDVVPEEDYPNINVLDFLLAKMDEFSTHEYPLGGHNLLVDLWEHEVEARKAIGMQWYSITPVLLNHRGRDVNVVLLNHGRNHLLVAVTGASNNRNDLYLIRVHMLPYFKGLIERGNHARFMSEALSVDNTGKPLHSGIIDVEPLEPGLTQAICMFSESITDNDRNPWQGYAYVCLGIDCVDGVEMVTLQMPGGNISYPKSWFYIYRGIA